MFSIRMWKIIAIDKTYKEDIIKKLIFGTIIKDRVSFQDIRNFFFNKKIETFLNIFMSNNLFIYSNKFVW